MPGSLGLTAYASGFIGFRLAQSFAGFEYPISVLTMENFNQCSC